MESSTRYPASLSPVIDLDFAKVMSLGTTTFGNMEAKIEYGVVLNSLGQPTTSHTLDKRTEVVRIVKLYNSST
jgi:hypothetical protein